ncbi:hypothetical protein FACS189434_05300 [Bacteroidia bacterium]|nr:hypothetical protein FACS189434_05300 [Bacteroidia bacterium]
METFFEILKFTIPSVLSLLAVAFAIDRFLKNEDRRRNYEIRKATASQLVPIRLAAYERLVLFLERSAPDSLLLRVQSPEMNNLQLQQALLLNVRQEWEHNFSQQLYVSEQAAAVVKTAKESLIQLINLAASRVESTGNSTQLSMVILETYSSSENQPLKTAVDFLKAEVRGYF